jgi:hypothetical protein
MKTPVKDIFAFLFLGGLVAMCVLYFNREDPQCPPCPNEMDSLSREVTCFEVKIPMDKRYVAHTELSWDVQVNLDGQVHRGKVGLEMDQVLEHDATGTYDLFSSYFQNVYPQIGSRLSISSPAPSMNFDVFLSQAFAVALSGIRQELYINHETKTQILKIFNPLPDQMPVLVAEVNHSGGQMTCYLPVYFPYSLPSGKSDKGQEFGFVDLDNALGQQCYTLQDQATSTSLLHSAEGYQFQRKRFASRAGKKALFVETGEIRPDTTAVNNLSLRGHFEDSSWYSTQIGLPSEIRGNYYLESRELVGEHNVMEVTSMRLHVTGRLVDK